MSLSASPYSDVTASVKSYRIWHLLAMQDIRQRYRRSTLGPLWITMSSLISIAALGVVYTKIFKIPSADYLPFLAIGIVFWGFISTVMIESCNVFVQAESMIKQVNLPFGIHVGRMVWRNLIILGHNLIVVGAVLLFARVPITPSILLLVPAVALATVTAIALGYLMGALCARFRDVPQIVSSLMQVLFYVTPVIWKPALLQGHEELLYLNPAHHFLEVLRAPLLGYPAPLVSWASVLVFTLASAAAAVLMLKRVRHRIAFWL